jgi:hypothetical protein
MCELTLMLLIAYGSINSILSYKVHRKVKGLERRERKREEAQ